MRHGRRAPAPVADLLRWTFRDAAGTAGPPPAWCGTGADARAAAAALTHHRGWTLLARRAGAVPGLPPALADEAARRRSAAVAQQMGVAADLQRCGRALDAARVPWLCVKGPVLQGVYARSGEDRTYADLDLLVEPGRFADALRALSSAGGALVDRNFALMRRRLPGEVCVRAPGGTVVDLHWSLVNKRERRSALHVPTEALVRAAAGAAGRPPTALPAEPAPPALPAEEAVVHLCLHAAGSGAARLGWLLDVALTLRHGGVRPGRLHEVAAAWGAERVVALVLERVGHHLDPAARRWGAAGVLAAGGWGAGERVARRLAVLEASDRSSPQARLAVGAVEHRTLTGFVAGRLVRRRGWGPAPVFVQDPADPGSALHDAGSLEDFSAYLDEVGRQASALAPSR